MKMRGRGLYTALCCCLAIVLVAVPREAQARGIYATVEASWTETPFLQEGCEWAARTLGNNAFFACLESAWEGNSAVSDGGARGAREQSQKSQLEAVSGIARTLSGVSGDGHALPLFRMEMAARVYSPAVEAHYTLAVADAGKNKASDAATCSAEPFAVVRVKGGDKSSSARSVKHILELLSDVEKSASQKPFYVRSHHDHIHPRAAETGSKVLVSVVLYGLVGEADTMSMYSAVLQWIDQHPQLPIHFAFRHLPVSPKRLCPTGEQSGQPHWNRPLFVQGYGATVDMKNMEYKVLDEKKQAEAEAEQHELGQSEERPASGVDEASDLFLGGFNVQILRDRYPALNAQLDAFASEMEETLGKEEPKVDFDLLELQSIGLAAAQYVHEARPEDRLSTLAEVVTRFPLYAARLSRLAAHRSRFEEMEAAIAASGITLPRNGVMLFLNGRYVLPADISLYGLLELMKEEEQLDRQTLLAFTTRSPSFWEAQTPLGVRGSDMDLYRIKKYVKRAMRRHIKRGNADAASAVRRLSIPVDTIHWISDIETDPLFAQVGRKLSTAFQHATNGMQLMPRRNLVHAVVVLDPALFEGRRMAINVHRLIQQGWFARFGIIIMDTSAKSSYHSEVSPGTAEVSGESAASKFTMLAAATAHQLALRGESAAIAEFLSDIALKVGAVTSEAQRLVVLERLVRTVLLRYKVRLTAEQLLNDAEFLKHYWSVQSTLQKLQMDRSPASVYVNGIHVPGEDPNHLYEALNAEIIATRQLIVSRVLTDDMKDFYHIILDHYGAATHPQPSLEPNAIQQFAWNTEDLMGWLQYNTFIHAAPPTSSPTTTASSDGSDGGVPTVSSVILIPCTASLQTLSLVSDAMEALSADSAAKGKSFTAQLAVASMCAAADGGENVLAELETVLTNVGRIAEHKRAGIMREYIQYVQEAADAAGMQRDTSLLADPAVLVRVRSTAAVPEGLAKWLKRKPVADPLRLSLTRSLRGHVRTQLGSLFSDMDGQLSHTVLIANGATVTLDTSFTVGDFKYVYAKESALGAATYKMLEKVQFQEIASENGFEADELDADFYAARTCSLASIFSKREASSASPMMSEDEVLPTLEKAGIAAFSVNSTTSPQVAEHKLTIAVDPTAREAQMVTALAEFLLRSPLGVSVTVFMQPAPQVTRPIRSLYTFVASADVHFDAHTKEVVAPAAIFRALPTQSLLTLGIEEPESWTVFSHRADADLDNIILARLPKHTQLLSAAYRINSILVTGTAAGASGLPLALTPTAAHHKRTDTLVMDNDGYFQLQAAPGVWSLSVLPGPLAETFYIHGVDHHEMGADPSYNYTAGQRIPVYVDSFRGRFHALDVRTAPGKPAGASVKDVVAGMASNTFYVWPPPHEDAKEKPDKPTLNIFSVASGHLYERFLRMMMFSVFSASSDKFGANRTRVKFWVIENFLSPQFKELVPLLAEHFGFEVGFVTYRWPWWLPKQTEKQRKIWAYKILFLDVLFPLDVERVIFVDADQTARADLHELFRMDIADLPIAMTPFCVENENKATTGFRFWTQGYWATKLQGKPYHISAIFLVDLQKFRALQAGNTYRMMYSRLTVDPNSLSNLDQDLPNSLQDHVKIYSLPEEWLWCETWCNAESKERAKTIDLCNNPLTKMPKLDNAKMIVPGWEDVDNMLESVSVKLLEEHHGKSQT